MSKVDEKPEITNKIDLPPSPLKNTTHIKPKDSPKNIFHNVNKSQAPEKQKPSPQKMLFNFQKIDPLPEIPLLQQKQPEEAKKISPIEIKEIFLPKEIKKETKTKCLLTDIFSNKNDILPPLKLKNSLENSDHEAISKNSVLESVIIKRPLQINEVSNNSQNNAQFEETKQTINDKAIDLFEETNLKIQPFEPVISNEIINQQSNLNGLGNVVSLNQTNPFNFQSKQLDNFQGQNNLNQIFSLFNAPAQNFQPTPITNSINTINNNNNQVYNPNLTQNNYANITQNPIPLINNLVPNNSMPYNTPNFVPNNAIANNNMPIFHHTSTNSNNLFNWGNNTNNCNIKTTMSLEDQINERKIFELQTQNNRIMLENECSANEQKKSLDISFSNNDIFATNINNNNNIGYYNNNNNQIVNNNHQYNNNINVPNDINNTITNLFSKKEVIPANNNNQNPIFSFHTPIASLFNNTNTNNGYNETNYNNSLAPKPENRGMERKPIDDVEARMIAKGKQQIKNTLRSNNY